MPLTRLLSIMLLSFLLMACGGGGTLEKDGTVGGDTDTDTTVYTLTLQGYSQTSDSESNAVTADAPIDLRVTLKQNDTPVAGRRITFSLADGVGELNPESALTQSDGIATVELSAGTITGAGEVTATYTIER